MKAKASFSAPLFVLVLYGFLIASKFLEGRLVDAGGNLYLSVIILQILIFLLPAVIYCRLKGVGYAVKLNVKLFSPGKLGCVVMTALVMILGSILIRFAQIYLFKMETFSFSLFDSYINTETATEFLFTATAFAIVPALTEEFIFRAILLTEYNEGGHGAVTATVISSLLCSMMYFRLEVLMIRFIASVLLCMLTYVSGSSVASFLAHVAFNIYGIFGEKYVWKALSDPSNKIISVFTFTILFLVMIVILLGEYEHTLRRMGQTGVPTPSYHLKKAADGKTPDVAATEAYEDDDPRTSMSESTKMGIEAFFSPTFLLCILAYAVAIFGFV